MDIIAIGIIASLGAGLATGVGALPIFIVKRVSQKTIDVSMGFSAGIMLAASFFSLLLPGIEIGGIWATLIGFLAGAYIFELVEKFTPHIHFIKGYEGPIEKKKALRKIWLFILAVTIHNIPEGLSVGIAFGSEQIGKATALAIGIGLQNMPEGLAVALPLLTQGYSKRRAFAYATLTGLVEPIAGIIGLLLTTTSKNILPYGLAFAAGAMIFVISEEIIPESHMHGHERRATFGLIWGFIVMMLLDSLFG